MGTYEVERKRMLVKNKLINFAIILCFLVGLLLIFINPIQNYLIAKTSAELAPVAATLPTPDVDGAEPLEEMSFDFEEVQSLTIWDVLKAQASKKNLPVIGSIHIPTVDMTLPILKGVGESSLVAGAGTMKPTQQMGEGNYALASHYIEGKDVLFGPLYDLQEGDSIFLTDLDYIYEYKTTVIQVIEETDVHVIDDMKDSKILTLITCAEEGTKRLAVQAEFIEKLPAEKSVALTN